MKTINRKHLPLPLAWVLCAGLLLCGCTKQTTAGCADEVQVDVHVVDVEGEDITDQGVIENLSLFVFDHDKLFLRRLDTRIGESLRLYFPDQDLIHVVSWGNLSAACMELTELTPGTPMHEAMVRLKDNPSAQNKTLQGETRAQTRGIAMTPDDLFYSYDEISLRTGAQTSYTIQMTRSVAAMSITMRNLQAYANRYDENYSLLVRETYDAIDFYGRLTGEKVGYIPASSFNDKKEMIAPLFNLLPSHPEGTIEIDVYHDGELITTVLNGPDGKPLRAQRGQVLNILVNFHLTVTVEVGMTPWGVTKIWKEY